MPEESKFYTLKLYDQPLIEFEVRRNTFGELKPIINNIDESNTHLLPLIMVCEPNNKGLKAWLEGRTIPKNRAFVENILETAGLSLDDKLGILDLCKGLSVNDSYWLDDGMSNKSFYELNLFDNQLDETLALVAYTGHSAGQKHKLGLSTEWTLDGQFPKAIRKNKDGLYLYKSGTSGASNSGFEPWSEYFAAQIAEQMKLAHVEYDLQVWKGQLASVCPIMNTKDTSLVPFWIAAGDARFPAALSTLLNVNKEMADFYRSMTVFDALICNRDRHGGNFGVLRDNKTGRIIGMAPLYDHNLSLFAQDGKEDYGKFLDRSNKYYQPAMANLSFNNMASIVIGKAQHEQLRKMIGFTLKNHPTTPMDEDRFEALNNYLQSKTRELLELPVVNELELSRTMNKTFAAVKEETSIPLLQDKIIPLA